MRQKSRGWIMPEADIASMLTLIDERIRSREIDMQRRDALIRLRAILEDDLKAYKSDGSSEEPSTGQEAAA